MKLFTQKIKALTGLERQKAHEILADMAERRPIKLDERTLKLCNTIGLYEIENDELTSFLGLTLHKTPYKFQTNGITTYGWTPWDLFTISLIIKEGTLIDFNEIISNHPIHILFDGAHGFTCGPAICASFPTISKHDTLEQHTETFSKYIHVFSTPSIAEEYAAQHEHVELISIPEFIIRAKQISNFFF